MIAALLVAVKTVTVDEMAYVATAEEATIFAVIRVTRNMQL